MMSLFTFFVAHIDTATSHCKDHPLTLQQSLASIGIHSLPSHRSAVPSRTCSPSSCRLCIVASTLVRACLARAGAGSARGSVERAVPQHLLCPLHAGRGLEETNYARTVRTHLFRACQGRTSSFREMYIDGEMGRENETMGRENQEKQTDPRSGGDGSSLGIRLPARSSTTTRSHQLACLSCYILCVCLREEARKVLPRKEHDSQHRNRFLYLEKIE